MRQAYGIAAATIMPMEWPVEIAKPIPAHDPTASPSRKQLFITSVVVSVGAESTMLALARSSGYQNCADDMKTLPKRFRSPQRTGRIATVEVRGLSNPSTMEPY